MADGNEVEMAMYAAAVRRVHGTLLGGDEGAAMVDAADRFMTGEGVERPDRWVELFVPGFPATTGGHAG